MSQMMIYEVLNRAIWVATEIGAPILLIGGGVGLLMALVQAATQLSEPALTFIPKLAAVMVAMLFMGPWAMAKLTAFYVELYEMIGTVSNRLGRPWRVTASSRAS